MGIICEVGDGYDSKLQLQHNALVLLSVAIVNSWQAG